MVTDADTRAALSREQMGRLGCLFVGQAVISGNSCSCGQVLKSRLPLRFCRADADRPLGAIHTALKRFRA